MHAHIIHNQRLLEASKARLHGVTPAMLYGRGVFTTLAVYERRPFLWSDHWARLTSHADRVRVDLSGLDEEGVSGALTRLIEANDVENGRARVTLLSRSASTAASGGLWAFERAAGDAPSDFLIMTGDARPVSDEGLALTVSPYRVNTLSPLVGIKSTNYLERIIAWEEALVERDFDEAVALNERGEVVSATMANIFWVTNGTAHTPALSTGALAGTTRARVIALMNEMAVPHVEGVYELSGLADADEIFLTSAGLGLAIVTTFDYRRYTVPAGSIALRLREAFRQLTLGAI